MDWLRNLWRWLTGRKVRRKGEECFWCINARGIWRCHYGDGRITCHLDRQKHLRNDWCERFEKDDDF